MHVGAVFSPRAEAGDVELAEFFLLGQLNVVAEVAVFPPSTAALHVVLADGFPFLVLMLVPLVLVVLAASSILHHNTNKQVLFGLAVRSSKDY